MIKKTVNNVWIPCDMSLIMRDDVFRTTDSSQKWMLFHTVTDAYPDSRHPG